MSGNPDDRIATKIAILRAYWQADALKEAGELEEALLHPDRRPPLSRVNRIMVIDEYSWILRQGGRYDSALKKIDETLFAKPGKYNEAYLPLLVARARIHVAQKNPRRAVDDLETLLRQVPPKQLPYRHYTAAHLMLGFLREEAAAGREPALADWRRGFRQHDRQNFLEDASRNTDHGSLGLLQGWMLGSLTGAMNATEANGMGAQVLLNGMDVTRFGADASRWLTSFVVPGLLPSEVIRKAWASDRARSNARQLAFQDLSLPDYLRLILATGAAAVLRQEVAGDLSPDQ